MKRIKRTGVRSNSAPVRVGSNEPLAVDSVPVRFCRALTANALDNLRLQALCEKLHQQAEQKAHQLAGALGGFSFPEGLQLAKVIEEKLKSRPSTHQAQSLTKLIAELRQSCNIAPTIGRSARSAQPQLVVLSNDLDSVQLLLKEAENYQLQVKIISLPEKTDDSIKQVQLRTTDNLYNLEPIFPTSDHKIYMRFYMRFMDFEILRETPR